MKRRGFKLLEMMQVLVIVGSSVELGKIIYDSRTVRGSAVRQSEVTAWHHRTARTADSTPEPLEITSKRKCGDRSKLRLLDPIGQLAGFDLEDGHITRVGD